VRPKLKICGLTEVEQAIEIALMGVDALGFILYPRSPRYIHPEVLKPLIRALPPLVKTVGVFVDAERAEVLDICRETGLDLAQLHGNESAEDTRWLSAKGQSWLKAIRVAGPEDVQGLEAYQTRHFLLDTKSTKGHGGTGETFDWSIAEQVSSQYQVILAGGLETSNLGAAVAQVRPYGLDLSSAVETSPGIKDMAKVRALVNRWRAL